MRYIFLVLLLLIASAHADTHVTGNYVYDAKMAFIKAGELKLDYERRGTDYQVAGEFKTSRAMSVYYTWNGVFATVGTWKGLGPVTTAYMSRTSSKDEDLKIVLTYPNGTRVLDSETGEFETVERPGGVDLISALFFSPSCYDGRLVHDGEDNYQLSLLEQEVHGFNGGKNYYRGEVTSCDYRVEDHKGRKRRVIVSVADINGTKVAVQIRAKIPLLPDAVFKLRVPAPESLALN